MTNLSPIDLLLYLGDLVCPRDLEFPPVAEA